MDRKNRTNKDFMTKEVFFIADVFVDKVPQGGAEIANSLLAADLRNKGYDVLEIETFRIDPAFFEAHKGAFFIVAGMIGLRADAASSLKKVNYVIYEHDHKYEVNRNPALYTDFEIPLNQLRFRDIYENAQAVICQSSFHKKILHKNLPNCKKIINAAGSIWSEPFLDFIEKAVNRQVTKNPRAAIIESSNPIKGQLEAEKYCTENDIKYDLISAPSPRELFQKLRDYEYFVFLPSTPETFSRIFVEAKLAGCKVVTNSLVGATYENYTYHDPVELLRELKDSRIRIGELFNELIPDTEGEAHEFEPLSPLVSIITSVYNGAEFIDSFMEDITKQSFFDRCELILVDCNCGASTYEKAAIEPYLKVYPNISYHELDEDPGVYGAWNYAIKRSKGEYITNANLDDHRAYGMIEQCYKFATANPEKELVYPCFLVTSSPDENFYTTRSQHVYNTLEFSVKNMQHCPPGCMPLWKKSLHEKNGMFDETYTSAGDLEFWLRCVQNGAEFMRLNNVLGLYYFNPKGLSTSPDNHKTKLKEEQKVFNEYGHLFR